MSNHPARTVGLMFDGWYTHKTDAQGVLDLVTEEGATPVGLVESVHGTWGVLYTSSAVLFENHRLDGRNALWHVGSPAEAPL